MTSCIVNADDLEALLFATSGIKDLEAALDQRRRNPMVAAAKGRLEGAHDRLSAAWRQAKREATWPKKVVTQDEIFTLKAMFQSRDGFRSFIILDDYPMHFAQDLMLVEAGPLWNGFRIEWPPPAEPQFCINHPSGLIRYGARLTGYGLQVLGLTKDDLVGPGHLIGWEVQPMISSD